LLSSSIIVARDRCLVDCDDPGSGVHIVTKRENVSVRIFDRQADPRNRAQPEHSHPCACNFAAASRHRLVMMAAMGRASTSPPPEITILVYVPRELDLAVFVQDVLAFKPIAVRVGRTVGETMSALREGPIAAMLVDLDGLAVGDAQQVAVGMTELGWSGEVIGVGTAPREGFRVDHLLPPRLTSVELRALLVPLLQARAPKIAVPMRT
jgi:hypothetical protein